MKTIRVLNRIFTEQEVLTALRLGQMLQLQPAKAKL